MKQVDMKDALMQSEEFRNAYMELKELLGEGEYWFVDKLEFYPDIVPVIFHPEYTVRYGELWLMFAEIKFPESFPSAKTYGFVIVDMMEEDEEKWENESNTTFGENGKSPTQ